MLRSIAKKTSEYEYSDLSKTEAKIRVTINALQPLCKETITEFATGEDILVSLDYKKLEKHCSICRRLSHEAKVCPQKLQAQGRNLHLEAEREDHDKARDSVSNPRALTHQRSHPDYSAVEAQSQRSSYQTRVDRHRRSFGVRVSTKKKHQPGINNQHNYGPREQEVRGPNRTYLPHRHASGSFSNRSVERSPYGRETRVHHYDTHSYQRQRQNRRENSQSQDLREHLNCKSQNSRSHHTPNLQWMECRNNDNNIVREEASGSSISKRTNLERDDFSAANHIPTTEEVMGILEHYH
ncbi:hypothetical protein V5N11_019576 [Cardamine amara subsp. amara]|uniref:Zinc knuckle CX2CX4HX4C domain-containing protein n=1 Tax=Cardamine amara subsp. amara TaxID=228776 RepID=A0ABD1C8W7_CARAN